MSKKLRVAVIGAGRLGGFHAQKLAARHDVERLAIVDPLPANRERVAAQCGAEALADYKGLIGSLDAAVIAAPTSLHHRIARDLLEAGVHLLVEKPLCSQVADAEDLVSASRRHQAILQVGHVERFNPAFSAASARIRNPKYIDAVRTSGFTFRSTDVGVVLDVMIHDIDLVLSMACSRVRKVDAIGFSVVGGHEDVANARLEFESGCVATLSASRVSYESIRRMHLWSLDGFAAVDFATRTINSVRPSETLRKRQFSVETLPAEQIDHYRQHFAQEHLPREEQTFEAVDALALEIDDFVTSIREGREPRVNGEAGCDALAIAQQILDRIAAHRWDGLTENLAGMPQSVRPPHCLPTADIESCVGR